jgi:hypothetical protein
MDIRIKKAEATVNVDAVKFPEHVRDHIFEYGLRQKLNDSISGLSRDGTASTTKATSEEMVDSVNETLARLYAGDLRATRSVDTVEREARRLSLQAVCNKWLRANKGKKLSDYEAKSADAAAYLAANREKILAAAQVNIDLTNSDDAAAVVESL